MINSDIPSYLTFKLHNELFALHVSQVLEILEMQPITKIPKAPGFMLGVTNLRGNILPVIDARSKFGLPEIDFTIDTCIIVISVQTGKETILAGAVVDAVQKVIDIPAEMIHPSSSLKTMYREDFISGIGKVDEDFILILNIDKVFSADEAEALLIN